MKKIIYTLIAAFVACTAVAQTPSAYFMEGSTFRSQLNPAFVEAARLCEYSRIGRCAGQRFR